MYNDFATYRLQLQTIVRVKNYQPIIHFIHVELSHSDGKT